MGNKVTSICGVDTSSVDDSPKFSLGTCVEGDGTMYQYVLAGATISSSESEASRFAVAIDENYSAQLVTTANATTWRRLGIAPKQAVASGKYFWVAVRGNNVPMRVVASAAADLSLRTTTTAGRLGSASTVSSVVYPGIVLVTAASASGASAGSTTRNAIVVSNMPTRKSAINIGAL